MQMTVVLSNLVGNGRLAHLQGGTLRILHVKTHSNLSLCMEPLERKPNW